ncbi:MAG: discoidin domain-containing protein [Lachnospiraceae bacterium]
MKRTNLKRMLSVVLTSAMVLSGLGSFTAHAATGIRPEDGVTEDQPFAPGTGGSSQFRIPCLVTLNDGTLVAACDARWTTYADGGGLDTIVSYSKDNGETWNYTFANYLGDNGNVWNASSTAFIDPALATDGETVYMIADLYPAGVALNGAYYAPQTGSTGYDENSNLILAAVTDSVNGSSSSTLRASAAYNYHLEKAEEGAESYYLLKDADGNTVDGYIIDAYFNIKGQDVDTNLFCGDSPYFPYPTDFLYFTKSADGGATWSVPQLLDVKRASEQTLLVGPGRSIVTSKGRIVFTAYEFTSGDKNSTVIYSDDGGATWERGESVSGWSSEAAVVEADGKLYMFTRHGNAYYVSEDWGETWSDAKSVGLSYNSNCQLSAITYSEKIDGKTAIMFSAPSDTGARNAGKIFVGLVQEDGSISWDYEFRVNKAGEHYAYSCITELADGGIGLLYESGGSVITYKGFSLNEILGLEKTIKLDAGTAYVEETASDEARVITQAPDEAVATVTSELVVDESRTLLHAHTSNAASSLDSFSAEADTSLNLANAEFTFNASGSKWRIYNEFSDTYMTIASAGNYFDAAAADMTVEEVETDDTSVFRIKNADNRYTVFYTANMVFDAWRTDNVSGVTNTAVKFDLALLEKQDTVSESDVIPGYARATEIEDGGRYLISYIWTDGSIIVLYPTEAQANQTKLVGDTVNIARNILTITGVAPGKTTAVVDDVIYNIVVGDPKDNPEYAGADIPVSELTATAVNWETNGGAAEGPASNVLDNNSSTIWHTKWKNGPGFENHWIQLELSSEYAVDGLRYQPRQSGSNNGVITEYEIQASNDGETWKTVATGQWAGDSSWKKASFDAVNAKYIRLVTLNAMSTEADNDYSSAAEIRLTGEEITICENPFTDVQEDDFFYDAVLWAVGNDITTGWTETMFAPELECTRGQIVTFLWRTNDCPEAETETEAGFTDVPSDAYYADAVAWAVKEGITDGWTETLFAPELECTRGQVVTFLWRAAGRPEAEAEAGFDDVAEDAYYADAVAWAVVNQITEGVNETAFEPETVCSRGEIAMFLYRSTPK